MLINQKIIVFSLLTVKIHVNKLILRLITLFINNSIFFLTGSCSNAKLDDIKYEVL